MLSGLLGAETVKGDQNHGVAVTIKHFTVNEQETHRADNGLFIWCNEQALREIYLKPFEIVVKKANPWGVMSSYSRIGAQWCGGCPSLLKDLLRKEWGFDGFVVTDYWSNVAGTGYMDPALAVYSGNDLMLSGLALLTTLPEMGAMKKAYDADPVGYGIALREASKNTLKMKMRTNAMTRQIEPADAAEEDPTDNNGSSSDTPVPDNQSGNGANTTPSGSGSSMNNGISGASNPSSGGFFSFEIIPVCAVLGSCILLGCILLLMKKRVKQI